jgi:hypothetical protein
MRNDYEVERRLDDSYGSSTSMQDSSNRSSRSSISKRNWSGCVIVMVVCLIVGPTAWYFNRDRGRSNESSSTSTTSAPAAAPSSSSSSGGTGSAAPTTAGYQACNGHESLCDVRANELLYAMLHNAVSTAADGVLVFPNHGKSLEDALLAGWRGLNFDIGKCDTFSGTNGGIRLLHGFCALGTRDPLEVFGHIANHLSDKPNDVLLIPIEINNESGGTVTVDEIYAVIGQVPEFQNQLYPHPGPGIPWPTLRELIAANTRILLFFYNGNTECRSGQDTCPPGLHYWFDYAAETQFDMTAVAEVENTSYSCNITRGGSGARDFFGINLLTQLPDYCDTLNAKSFVADHLQACSTLNSAVPPSAVLVDCWERGDVLTVVQEHNAALGSPAAVQQATVDVQMNGVSGTLNGTDELVFVQTCSKYFAQHLSARLRNVFCSLQDQQQAGRRNLQTASILFVSIKVSGDDDVGDQAFTSKDLATIVDDTGAVMVSSLTSTGSTVFASLTSVGAVLTSVVASTPNSTNTTTQSRVKAVRSFVLKRNWSQPELLTSTNSTPQVKAVHWIADKDPLQVAIGNTVAFRERYALAVFYFALDGKHWMNSANWLTGTSVCKWNEVVTADDGSSSPIGVLCNNNDQVSDLNLPSIGLNGSVPDEINLLTSLTGFVYSGNNVVGGPSDSSMSPTTTQTLNLLSTGMPTVASTTLTPSVGPRPTDRTPTPSVGPRPTDRTPSPTMQKTTDTPIRTPSSSAPSASTAQKCNGLENLCNIPVNNILFATVHNAGSTTEDGVTLFPNQNLKLEKALAAGFRGINIDIGKCDGEIKLVHGICFVGFRDFVEVFTDIVSFLDANPNEVLLMPVEINSDTGGAVTLDEIDAMMQNVTNLKRYMYTHDSTQSWPTMRDLIQANTRILFFQYNGESCGGNSGLTCPSGLNDWFCYAEEGNFEFDTLSQFDDKSFACKATRGGTCSTDFYGVNVFETIPSASDAETLNSRSFLQDHITQCASIAGQDVNLVLVDFWDIGNVLDVVREYNALL